MKKINLRESLLKIDRSTDFKHALTDLYEACMLEEGDKKKLAQFIEDKDIPGMSAMLSNKAGIMSENVSDDLPDDEVALVENDTMSLYRVANLEDIDYIMSYEMPDCIVYGGDVEGEYKCAYHNGVSVNVKFNPDAPGYVYTIDGEGPYETHSSETVSSDITRALSRKGWNEAFPNGSPIDRVTGSGDELDEGIFSIAGDTIRKGMNDFYKGAKSVAGGVKDIAKAGMNDAKNAVTDIKQSKGMAKVRDAARALKNSDTVDQFKSDYKKRQDMRKKSDAKRDQVWTDRQGNQRTGKSIGNEQDWTYIVDGKKMKYDDYMKIPSDERQKLNNAGKVRRLDLSGKPITKNQNDKRLNASWMRESVLNEGPGAGYEISCAITVDGFEGGAKIKRIEVDRDPGATPNSYKVYLSCNANGHVDGLEAHSYYYGDSFTGTYPVKISELLVSVSVVGDGDLREVVESSIDGILADLVGFTFTSKYTYGGGWCHSTYDGTITDTTNPLNDSYWGEDDTISFEVYGMDAKLTDNGIIDEIDMTVSGENEYEDGEDFEESLTESIDVGSRVKQTWANPYNVGTVIDSRITPAEGLKLKVKWDYSDGEEIEWVNSDEVSPYNEEDERAGLYESAVTEEPWDSSRAVDLVAHYLDRSNVPDNTLVRLIMRQMKDEGSRLPYNITDFYDTVYSAIYKYNSGSINEDWTHFTFKSGANPYIAKTDAEVTKMLKKYGDKAKKVKDGYYEIDDGDNTKDLFALDGVEESWTDDHQDIMARKTSGYDRCYKAVKKALSANDTGALEDACDHFGADLYKMCLKDARKELGESLREAFKPAESGVQSVKVYNQYNYTIQELRIDNDNRTFERGNFTMGRPDKKFKNRQQYEDVVDTLKELGYTEIESDYRSLRNKSRKGEPTTEAFIHPQFPGPWWYLCKHGIGPGALPKGVTVVDTMDDEENPNRVYVALDKVLTTSELKQYEMSEKKPPKLMKESKSMRESIYLFPELTPRDKRALKSYGLTYMGKNYGPYDNEDNWVVSGSESALRSFADNYLGYELHPDYLYDSDDFAGDIITEDRGHEDAESESTLAKEAKQWSDDKELTYEEAMALARAYYSQGGDSFYETTERYQFEDEVGMFGPMTVGALKRKFRNFDSVYRDRSRY